MGKSEELLLGFMGNALATVNHIAWTEDPGEEPQLAILTFAVDNNFKNQGVGSAALHTLIKVLQHVRDQNNSACGAFARIHRDNFASQGLFGKLGFENLGEFDSDPNEVWVHDLL